MHLSTNSSFHDLNNHIQSSNASIHLPLTLLILLQFFDTKLMEYVECRMRG